MSIKLVADGGEITVGARVAVYTYGAFNVVLPEGRELAVDEYTDDGYTNGYVYRPKQVEQLGRFDIAFARADVTVETNAGYSNFEAVVDASQRKVAEDVYFERDITGAGLGVWTPGEDYGVGDVVDVLVFNRVIPQPVTAITYTSAPDDPLGVRVHVGGQTIRDAELVEEQNRSVREAIAQESAQRRKQVGAVQSTATAAKNAADSAKQAVEDAEGTIRRGVETVTEMIASGRDSWGKAAQDYEKASAEVQAGLRKLEEAERLLKKSDATLAENETLSHQVKQTRDQVAVLADQIRAENSLMRQIAQAVGVSAGQAVAHSAQAAVYVEQAEDLREQIAGLVAQAREHISTGEQAVSSAKSEVAKAQAMVAEAKKHAEKVDRVLAEIKPLEQSAKAALGEAGTTLAALKGEVKKAGDAVSEIDRMQTNILAKHKEIMDAHQTWLVRHDEALDLLSRAVKAAAAGAGYAASGAMSAAQAAQEALNAAAANAKSIELLDEITHLHGKAIKELKEADKKFKESIDLLQEAKIKQAEINKQHGVLNQRLDTAQGLIQQQVENNTQSLIYTNAAVRAVAGATGHTAMAAQYAADVGRNAADVGKKALDVAEAQQATLSSMRQANTARDEAAKITEFYAAASANLQTNAMEWNWQRRTQTFLHTGSKTETFGDLLRVWPINEQRAIRWEAVGKWWGRVVMITESLNGYGENPQQIIHAWGVGPGYRSGTADRGKLLHAVVTTLILVEVWVPENPVFLLPVDGNTGRFIPTTMYDSEGLKPVKFLSDGRVDLNFPWTAEITPQVEISGSIIKPKKMQIPGTTLEVWPPYVAIKQI